MPPRYPTYENRASQQKREPSDPDIRAPETPPRPWNQVRARRLPILHVQENHGRDRGYNCGPKENPRPPDRQRNGIIEHIAIPPFRLASLGTGIGAPALEACRANVLRSQLQITERAHESAAALAARLKGLVRMKKTCRLVRKRGRCIVVLANHRPDADLQPLLAVGTTLPFVNQPVCPVNSEDRLLAQVQSAMTPGHRLRKGPSGRSR